VNPSNPNENAMEKTRGAVLNKEGGGICECYRGTTSFTEMHGEEVLRGEGVSSGRWKKKKKNQPPPVKEKKGRPLPVPGESRCRSFPFLGKKKTRSERNSPFSRGKGAVSEKFEKRKVSGPEGGPLMSPRLVFFVEKVVVEGGAGAARTGATMIGTEPERRKGPEPSKGRIRRQGGESSPSFPMDFGERGRPLLSLPFPWGRRGSPLYQGFLRGRKESFLEGVASWKRPPSHRTCEGGPSIGGVSSAGKHGRERRKNTCEGTDLGIGVEEPE